MILKNLSRVPFCLINLAAPTDGGGGGEPEKIVLSATAPELVGKTPEEKISSATGIIADLFSKATKLFSRLTAAESTLGTVNEKVGKLEASLREATGSVTSVGADLEKEKGEHGKTKDLLTSANSAKDRATKHVGLLESFCRSHNLDISGIDPDKAVTVPAQEGTMDTVETWNAKLAAAKGPEEQYQVLSDFQKAVQEGKVKKSA